MKKSMMILLVSIICMVIIFCLTGCSSNETSNEDLRTKAVQELDYLDTQIVSILNQLNNISFQNYSVTSEEVSIENSGSSEPSKGNEQAGDENQQESSSQEQSSSETITSTQMEANTVLDTDENNIDWNIIRSEIETINETWGVVILDLTNLNVNNNDILGFSGTLDDCIVSIENENKADTLTNMAKLYSYIPKFEGGIYADNNTQNIKQIKSYAINAYSLVEQDDWTGIETNISECEKIFKNIINDIDYIRDKEYKINKTYVFIKELQNSLSYKNKKLFYVKYKNLMESISTL